MNAAAPSAARSLYAEFSIGLLLGVGASAVAAVPAAVRISGAGVSAPSAWLSLLGSTALMLAPAIGALRTTRPLPKLAFSVPAGLLVAAPVLIILARILKTTTHHRPLGAASFAMLAAMIVLGAIWVSARLLSGALADGRWRQASRVVFWLLLGGSGLLTLALSLPARGSVIDALLALGLGAVAVWLPAPAALDRAARIAGPIALLIAVGAGLGARSAAVKEAGAAAAPVLAGPLR